MMTTGGEGRGAAGRQRGPHQSWWRHVLVAVVMSMVALAPAATWAAQPGAAPPAEAEPEPAGQGGSADGEKAPPPEPEQTESFRLEEHEVVGASEEPEEPRFLPDVKGTEIFSGKKTTVIDPEEAPQIVNDNYRQVLSRVPGLNLSEDATPLVSIGYRGLDPHRTQYTLVLKDGIPIAADMFGYPENYYLPPIDSIEDIEFIHGGAALIYGPQPGGALNYITKKPNPDRTWSLYSNQTFGSDNYYSTYNAASGTVEKLGYYVYYYQKQGDGFREANSQFNIYSGSAKLTYEFDDSNRLLVAFDGYNDTHGEPGGLRLESYPGEAAPPPFSVFYEVDRDASSRFVDEFALQRYIGWGIFESDLTADTLWRTATWGGRYTRSSYRQNGTPGQNLFGTIPQGQTNTIELARFNSFGFDSRVRHDWMLWGEVQTVTGGIEFYYDDAPRTDELGPRPDARGGKVETESFRETVYGSIFAENRFVWGDFQLIPALRFENYSLSVIETVNVRKQRRGEPLANESDFDFQPLFGIGGVYTIRPTIETYVNVSSAYRPQLFTQAVPSIPGLVVAGNLAPSISYQYEIGFRGYPEPWVYWDTSLFYLDFEDQIGTVQLPNSNLSEVRNVGAARHYGWEIAAQLGVLSLIDYQRDTGLAPRFGDISLFGSLMLLDAEFTSANPPECGLDPSLSQCLRGKTPAYAPDYIVRAGVEYVLPAVFKASLLTTAVADQYANDNNTPQFFIPSYTVSDLTFEANVWGETVALYAGINNLFDQDYYARIRTDGIVPAYARNYYGGFKVYF